MKTIVSHGVLFILLINLVWVAFPSISWANSAEPPALVVLVNHPPDDLSMILVSDKNTIKSDKKIVAWEGYYSFYPPRLERQGDYILEVTTKEKRFELPVKSALNSYHNVMTLDVSNATFIQGTYPLRSAILIGLRLLLTLLIEAIIFWSFGFRKKKSWAIFLGINLLTQGALNIILNGGSNLMPSYLIMTLIVLEILVLAVEMLGFSMFVKEHTKKRILLYAFVANLMSFIAGGYMITLLPV